MKPRSAPHTATTFAILLFLFVIFSGRSFAATDTASLDLYPGISLSQDSLARGYLSYVHRFQWDSAAATALRLGQIERDRSLPPLGVLLELSSAVLRVQNGEYESEEDRIGLVRAIDSLKTEGLSVCESLAEKDTFLTTLGFIRGGLLGYSATLNMFDNPLSAFSAGHEAFGILESVLEEDSSFADAFLGLGIFHCTIAKAPEVVRKGLKLFGTDLRLDEGLSHLRKCAQEGRYTSTAARLYLIRFLSPYFGHLAEEKYLYLDRLQDVYPTNPYYWFLECEERLCFHRKSFFTDRFRDRLAHNIPRFELNSYSLKRYNRLVRHQFHLLEPVPDSTYSIDTLVTLRDFQYYPLFLWTIQQGIVKQSLPAEIKAEGLYSRIFRRAENRVFHMLQHSEMRPMFKGHYQWHLEAALGRE